MISNLKVENFESHHKTELNFKPGITVISGATDVGKSSLRRILEWVTCNRPSGKSFISWGKSKATVTLDGVKKSRSSKAHMYEVGGHKYKAFRTDVPAPVFDALKISEINFQKQHNPYFLINDSPGQVARTLNKVAELTLIDDTLQEGRSRLRNVGLKVSMLKNQKIKKEKEMEEKEWAVSAMEELEIIQNLISDQGTMQGSIEDLNKAISSVQDAQAAVLNYPIVDSDIKVLETAKRSLDHESIDQLQLAIFSVKNSTKPELKDVPMDLKKIFDFLPKLNRNDAYTLSESIHLAQSCEWDLEDLKDVNIDYKKLEVAGIQFSDGKQTVVTIEDILEIKEECERVNVEYGEKKEAFESKLKELGICPLCGGDV